MRGLLPILNHRITFTARKEYHQVDHLVNRHGAHHRELFIRP